MELKEAEVLDFLKGGGETGELIRSKDWTQSVIGTPDNWPGNLRIAISILLNSKFPMFVWWGPELITFYNDAYAPIAGEKHPAAIGESGYKVWAEIWDVVGPLAEKVMKQGGSTWAEDQVLYINRHGYVEETYFTFSYSPIINESGRVNGVFCACTETTGNVLATRRIQKSEQNLRNTILQAPVAMCILKGPHHVVEIANDRMFELWGRTSSELLNKPIFEGLPEARQQGLEQLLHRVYQTGERFSGNERPVTLPRNGHVEMIYLNFLYEPFREGDGSISGVMAVAIDVTELVTARHKIEESEQELQQRVKERTAELEKKNVELEQYAHVSSHDLQEPLRKINLFSSMIRERDYDKLSDYSKVRFDKIGEAIERMSKSLKDLLDFASLSRKDYFSDVDLNTVITDVSNDLELVIEQKKASVNSEKLPVIKAVPLQMHQLFYNLLNNALKFAKQDQSPVIDITVRYIKGAQAVKGNLIADKEYAEITFRDNGIGFSQENAARIFTMFQRLHTKHEYGGTGIGLALCRKVMMNHNGIIWAESNPGQGATFKVLLPFDNNVQ